LQSWIVVKRREPSFPVVLVGAGAGLEPSGLLEQGTPLATRPGR
jgi:hypothetical protein